MCRNRLPRLSRQSGFTLIELLVALVVSGILAGVIFQLIGGQAQVTERQSARESVQQNTRAVLELISSELRSATGEGIRQQNDHSVVFYAPRVWGVVCKVDESGDVFLAFPRIDGFDPFAGRHWVAIDAGAAWEDNLNVDPADSAECPVSEGPQPVVTRVTSSVSYNDPAELLQSPAYLYQQLGYEIRSFNNQDWIYRGWRNRGVGNMQWEALAGPVDGSAGISFAYDGDPIDRIRVRVRSRERGEMYVDSVLVHLRGI